MAQRVVKEFLPLWLAIVSSGFLIGAVGIIARRIPMFKHHEWPEFLVYGASLMVIGPSVLMLILLLASCFFVWLS